MPNVWVTKNGQQLAPKDFTDVHLINTLRFIERNAESSKEEEELACITAQSFLQGEMAQYHAERDERLLDSMSIFDYLLTYLPIYINLRTEAQLRGLQWESLFEEEWGDYLLTEDEEEKDGDDLPL